MLAIHGGKRSKNKRGGGSLAALSPGIFGGVGNLATPGVDPNYAETPQTIPGSKMIGGAYGYASGSNAATFGGSYPEIGTVCTNGNADPSRGGNNFMSGGSRRTKRSKKGGKRSRTKRSSKKGGKRSRTKRSSKKGGKRSRTKRSSKKGGKRSRTKRSRTKRSCTKKHKHSIKKGGKIYKQRGCSKTWKGGVLLV
jgi:hypothetical protein